MTNIFDVTVPEIDHENFRTLLEHKNVEIKTIVSNTLKTPQTYFLKTSLLH